MNGQHAIQNLLTQKLLEAKTKNAYYSLRAFSRRLKIGAGPLSQILAGKRSVSRKLAEKLCERLLLDPEERSQVLRHFQIRMESRSPRSEGKEGAEPSTLRLSADQFRMISEWHHFGILSLIRLPQFNSDPKWIADRLGITVKRAEDAIECLRRLGLIEMTANGKIQRTKSQIRTTDDIADLSIRKAHLETLELARRSLEHDPVEIRDFATVTFVARPEKIPAAKELIRKFQDDLTDLMEEGGPATEVYRFSTELFPLTRVSCVKGEDQKSSTLKVKPSSLHKKGNVK